MITRSRLTLKQRITLRTGKIAKDQVVDYAQRKGIAPAVAEKNLSPILGYDIDD
jgi:hypothetical protein